MPGNFLDYLITLALVDTFLILLFLLDNIFFNHHEEQQDDWYYTVITYLMHPIKKISITMAVLWVVVLAVERYIAVTFPLRTPFSSSHSQ